MPSPNIWEGEAVCFYVPKDCGRKMRIKRLEIKVEYEAHSMHVFHTDEVVPNGDPPTIIVVNGKEINGTVSFEQIGDNYNITIAKSERVA